MRGRGRLGRLGRGHGADGRRFDRARLRSARSPPRPICAVAALPVSPSQGGSLAAADSRLSGAERKVVLPMERVNPELVRAVRDGTYVVDPRLVADAILRRHERLAEAERLAAVLETRELDGGAVGGAEDDAGAWPDVA